MPLIGPISAVRLLLCSTAASGSDETIALPRFLEQKALRRLQVIFAFSLLAWRVGLVFCPLPAGARVIVVARC
jgi:hypothetical protein